VIPPAATFEHRGPLPYGELFADLTTAGWRKVGERNHDTRGRLFGLEMGVLTRHPGTGPGCCAGGLRAGGCDRPEAGQR
jgi:hypothetical protein